MRLKLCLADFSINCRDLDDLIRFSALNRSKKFISKFEIVWSDTEEAKSIPYFVANYPRYPRFYNPVSQTFLSVDAKELFFQELGHHHKRQLCAVPFQEQMKRNICEVLSSSTPLIVKDLQLLVCNYTDLYFFMENCEYCQYFQ